jgi:hypothetical protein
MDATILARLLRNEGTALQPSGINETVPNLNKMLPEVQRGVLLGKIPPHMAQFLHDINSTPGSNLVETGSDKRGISEQQENYNKRVRSGQLSAKPYEVGGTTKLNMGASSDANVYPAASDLNYYRELKQALLTNPTYKPYLDEVQKIEMMNPTFRNM